MMRIFDAWLERRALKAKARRLRREAKPRPVSRAWTEFLDSLDD